MVTIEFVVKGKAEVDEEVYSDAWINDDRSEDKAWSDLNEQEKADFVKEVEFDRGYEGLSDKIQEAIPEMTAVTIA